MMLLLVGSMSTRILGFGIIATGGVILAIALIIGIGFPKFVYHENLKNVCLLSAKPSEDYDEWVNETFWSNWNRIYYWELINKDDFLYHSAAPLFQQRGPYVYFERHSKIDVRFVSSVTEFRVWRHQVYDDSKTKEECGANCSENDQITVLNLDYFRRVGKHGSDLNLTLSLLGDALNETLNSMTNYLEDSIKTWNYSRTLELLGVLDPAPFREEWRLLSNVTTALKIEFSFGVWMGKNDSVEKAEVLERRNFRDFNETEMRGLYELLKDRTLLGDTSDSSCSVDWAPGDPDDLIEEFRAARETEVERPCGLLMLLLRFREYREDRELIRNVTRMSAGLLCPDPETSCFGLSQDVTLSVLWSYVVEQLTRHVFYVEIVLDGEDLVTTKNQRELATGRTPQGKSRVDGILEDFREEEAASTGSRIISVYNCYDAVQAATSGLWHAYDGKSSATVDQFPKASIRRRRISRSLRYQVAPSVNLTACASYSIAQPYYSVFLPEFARAVTYEKTNARQKLVDRLVFKESNLYVDDEFVFTRGLQDMTGVNGYMSWVSLPHYLYGNASLQQQFNMTPSPDIHLPYRDFEPMAGAMWQDVVRSQVSVGLRPEYITLTDRPPSMTTMTRQGLTLRVNFTLRPMPVYWTEKSSSYNDRGTQHFYTTTGHYMTVSCGGLISLSVIAGLIIVLGLLAATVTVRDGRVMPIMEDTSFY